MFQHDKKIRQIVQHSFELRKPDYHGNKKQYIGRGESHMHYPLLYAIFRHIGILNFITTRILKIFTVIYFYPNKKVYTTNIIYIHAYVTPLERRSRHKGRSRRVITARKLPKKMYIQGKKLKNKINFLYGNHSNV